MKQLSNIVLEFLEEAKEGNVIIGDDFFPIAFNTKISNDYEIRNDANICELNINSWTLFVEKLEEYVNNCLSLNRKGIDNYVDVNSKIKHIIACLFANATTEDFKNPIKFIDRQISFTKDSTLNEYNEPVQIKLYGELLGHNLIVKNSDQSILMETPYKLISSITDGPNIYRLPDISYAINTEDGEKVCYIYSVIDKSKQEKSAYYKRINRLLYKINSGIDYNLSEDGTDDIFTENITDVTMSSVYALSVFLGLLQKNGINKIKAAPYLPVRYFARDLSADRQTDLTKKEAMYARNDMIQKNITEKFIRTFRRIEASMSGLEIEGYPYENDEYLTICINGNLRSNNEMLDDVEQSIKNR